MEPLDIKSVCIESCTATFNYYQYMQYSGIDVARAPVKVVDREIMGEYVVLRLAGKLFGLEDSGLSINGKAYFEPEISFYMYDEEGLCITLFPSDKVMDLLINNPKSELAVIKDLKFLIERARAFYDEFGDYLGYPAISPQFSRNDYTFPKGSRPSEEQKDAVHSVLNSKLTYVWGAPGTGKTQFVLATAILANIRKGKKVLVSAPTNNSVEQVLRGILKIIQNEDPDGKELNMEKDVVRMGIPSAEFVKDFPGACTQIGIYTHIKAKERYIDTISEILFLTRKEILKAHFDELDTLFNEEYDRATFLQKKKIMSQALEYYREIEKIVSINKEFAPIVKGIDEYNLRGQYPKIKERLYERPHPGSSYEQKMSPEEIKEKISAIRSEIIELQKIQTEARLSKAKIIACTPQKFMAFAGPPGAERLGDRFPLQVDHIFIDEVGYCNVVNALPFFMFGKPITMLGDHMQLPPVCEIEPDVLENAINEQNSTRYAFLWAQSALYAESMFFKSIEEVSSDFLHEADPKYGVTKQLNLTESHRFGDNLAKILDKHIYNNGIKGISGENIQIECIDAVCQMKESRENTGEADKISTYLKNNPHLKDFVILTPYKNQVDLLKKRFPDLKENISTIHGSQGREWGTVILSVADNRVINKDNPLRFTSTKEGSVGRKVINTAVSRAKKRLVIVCDCEFWSELEEEMIGEIVREYG